MTPPKTQPKSQNGLVTNTFNLEVDELQLRIILQFCVQGQFPTAETKEAAAGLQRQVEALVPQEA
jgi:hypothetical protein